MFSCHEKLLPAKIYGDMCASNLHIIQSFISQVLQKTSNMIPFCFWVDWAVQDSIENLFQASILLLRVFLLCFNVQNKNKQYRHFEQFMNFGSQQTGPCSDKNLISIWVTDYIQARRCQALLFSFEYNLTFSKFDAWIGHKYVLILN